MKRLLPHQPQRIVWQPLSFQTNTNNNPGQDFFV